MRKKVLITLLSLIGVCCVSTSAIYAAAQTYSARQAESVSWEEVNVSSSLSIGDTLSLPARSVTVDGKAYDSTVKIIYPDGSSLKKTAEYSQAKLTLAGNYSLLFEARDDSGALHSEKLDFTVSDKLWKTNNSKSTAAYGAGALATSKASASNGLLVSLVRGDSLTLGKIIDVSDITASTTLISGYVEPKEQGSADFDSITFTFTDVYNPEITLSVRGNRSTGSDEFAKGITYWMACGNGQVYSGYESSNFHHGDGYGYPAQQSFSAMEGYWHTAKENGSTPCASNHKPFIIKLDPATSRVYFNGTLITDLADPELHQSESVWKGFTSNKVTLTVSVDGVTGESASFCLTSVLGYDFTQENSFVDTDAPVITIDNVSGLLDESENYVPYAVKGGSYPVLPASAFDEYSGDLAVTAEVYYNYNNGTGMQCVVNNGRFNVTRVGSYAVVYTATDHFGNVAQKVCSITAVNTLETPLSVAIEGEKPSSAYCGERVVLPTFTCGGGSGDSTCVITATLGGEVIDVSNGVFIPEKAGEWTITYMVSDITNLTATDSFKINVTAKNVPVFVDDVILPKYLISGMSYVVPEVYANNYTGTEVKRVAANLVLNGKEYKAGEKFVPVVAKDGDKTTLTFKAGESTLSYDIETVVAHSDGSLYVEKLFRGENFSYVRDKNGLAITAAAEGDVSWTFANSVIAEGARVLIAGDANKDKFGELAVTLTDAENEDIAVTLTVINQKGKSAHVVFGDADRDIAQGFALSDNSFEIGFNGSKFYVGNVRATVLTDDQGNAFNGFPSDRVYISVNISEAKVGAGYTVKEIDNHTISGLSVDRVAPRIVISGEYGGLYKAGDQYVINPALVSDAIDPSASATLTVKTPAGKIAKDVNGKELNAVAVNASYTITLTEVGQYNVVYTATDSESNKKVFNYGVNILDTVAPVIKFGSAAKQATVGEKFTFPAVTVTDDVTSSENLIVYLTVKSYDGVLTELGGIKEDINGTTYTVRYDYTFRYAGEYTLMALAMDEAGNQTLATFTVTVK